jgi:ABC-2 type transport system ATP-binding protein
MLTTLLKPLSGTVKVFGTNAAHPMRVRRIIGYVPQLLSADATLTGWENVQLFARLFDVPRRQRAERVDSALAAMGLTEPAGRLVSTYSGGMVRRLEWPRRRSMRPGCWCWTSRPWGWTRSPAPTCGSTSPRSATASP